jgi:predicted nucleic acid-binding protein
MTEKSDWEFVDTNILVYSYDTASGEKFEIANQLIKTLWQTGKGCLSTQVLQEFYVNLIRKMRRPLSSSEARQALVDFGQWVVFRPEVADLLAAIDLHQRYQISFWDALVIRSAQQTGCKVLWSEDLADGQAYDGVKVVNPFK